MSISSPYDFLKSLQSTTSRSTSNTNTAKTSLTASINVAVSDKTAEKSQPESYLQNKYSGLDYHVYDAANSAWGKDPDFPVDLLFSGSTSSLTGYEKSSSIDESVMRMLSVEKNSYSVFIHPDVQEKMDQDPEYAAEIIAKIEAHFEKNNSDVKALENGQPPIYTLSHSQALSIGADGEIAMWAGIVTGYSENTFEDGAASDQGLANLGSVLADGSFSGKISATKISINVEVIHREGYGSSEATVRLSVSMSHVEVQSLIQQNQQQLITTFKGDVIDLETGFIVDRKG